jgi:hypothetical protein
MKCKLSLEMARYRRYEEPFVLRVESSQMGWARREKVGNGAVRITEHRTEHATLPAADQGSRASSEEARWTTQ